MNIHIATDSDLPEVIKLGEMLQDESKAYEPLLKFDAASALAHYTSELTNDNALIITASIDGVIVGYQYSFVSMLDYLEHHNVECTLEALYVLPDYRGRGIAKQLLGYSEDWAINTKHVDRIKASIYSGNVASEQMHLKYGFRAYNTEYIRTVNNS